jgi:flotillin
VDLTNALSRQNIRIDVPSRFTVGISTEAGVMQNAAERLLGLKLSEIQELAKDIIFGQLRLVIATMDIEEINTDRDKFLEAVSGNVDRAKKDRPSSDQRERTDINDDPATLSPSGRGRRQGHQTTRKNPSRRPTAKGHRDSNAQVRPAHQGVLADSEALQGKNTRGQMPSRRHRRDMEADALPGRYQPKNQPARLEKPIPPNRAPSLQEPAREGDA